MWKLCKKDLKLFFSNRSSILLSFLIPIILITLFALVFGGVGGSDSDSRPVSLPVADMDQSPSVAALLSSLDSVKGLQLKRMPLEEARQSVVKGKNASALVFQKGFEDSLKKGAALPVELMYDQVRQTEIGLVQAVLVGNLLRETGKMRQKEAMRANIAARNPGLSPERLDSLLQESQASGASQQERAEAGESVLKLRSVVGQQSGEGPGLIQAVAGTAILMLLFSIAGFGGGLLEEKESGTLRKLLYAPINPISILLGKMMAGWIISLAQLGVMFGFAALALGLDVGTDIPSLLMMILATGFACSSFGIFLASVARTRQQVQGLSTLIVLIMSAIGGSMMPIFIMPLFMQKIAVFSVNYWGIQGFYDIFWRHLPLIEIMPRALVLLAIGLAMTLLSVQLFKRNLLKMI